MKGISLDAISEINKLREDGLSLRAIGEIIGVSRSTVFKYVKIHDPEGKLKIVSDITPRMVAFMMSFDDDVPSKDIAEKLGVSVASVCKYRKINGRKLTKLPYVEAKKRKALAYKRSKSQYKQKCVDYLGGKCIICGYNKSLKALEFHHRDPSKKDFPISGIRKSWDFTKKELNKCDLLCANCHREEHEKINDALFEERWR
jgi:predicted transcriptional regulator